MNSPLETDLFDSLFGQLPQHRTNYMLAPTMGQLLKVPYNGSPICTSQRCITYLYPNDGSSRCYDHIYTILTLTLTLTLTLNPTPNANIGGCIALAMSADSGNNHYSVGGLKRSFCFNQEVFSHGDDIDAASLVTDIQGSGVPLETFLSDLQVG